MIFTGEHWTYGAVQAAVIVVEILLLRFVAGRNRVLDRFVVWAIAVFLVLYKLDEYGFGKSVPLDLSAMSYFLFGLAAVVPFRPLKCAASFSAMLSGAIYALTMLLFPESHFSEVTSVTQDAFLIRMAMLNHNLLFVGGGFMCSFARFGREDFVWLFGWYGFFMAYLKLMVDGFGVSTKYVSIIRIMDGSLVADVLGVSATPFYIVVFYVVVAVGFTALVLGFHALNRAFDRRRQRRNPFLPSPRALSAYYV